jgi:hypothetical protein
VADHVGLLVGKEERVALILDVAVVTHGPARRRAVVRPGEQHDEIDVAHFLGEVG